MTILSRLERVVIDGVGSFLDRHFHYRDPATFLVWRDRE